jgi:hypothetical protein
LGELVNKRLVLLAFALLATLGLALTVADDEEPGAVAVSEPTRAAKPVSRGPAGAQANVELAPQVALLQPRDTMPEGKSTGAAFAARTWDPPPPPLPRPGPPVAPPLPFTYVGKKFEEGSWEVFIELGERVLVVQERDLIAQQWRVDKIEPSSMTLTYLPLNQKQSLSIVAAN